MRAHKEAVLTRAWRSIVAGLETPQVCFGAHLQCPQQECICAQQEDSAQRLAPAKGA
jgi:hypothetical protein